MIVTLSRTCVSVIAHGYAEMAFEKILEMVRIGESARIENVAKPTESQRRPGLVRVGRDEAEGFELAEREEVPRGERADVLVVIADDNGRFRPLRQALVLHADQHKRRRRCLKCGNGRGVGADQ